MIAVYVIPPKGNQNGDKGDRQRETIQRNSEAKLYSHRTTANNFNWYFSFVLMKVHAGFWKATPDHFWAWSHSITIVHPHNNVDDLFNGKSVGKWWDRREELPSKVQNLQAERIHHHFFCAWIFWPQCWYKISLILFVHNIHRFAHRKSCDLKVVIWKLLRHTARMYSRALCIE